MSSEISRENVATEKCVIPAVSSSLFLASILAFVEAIVLFFGVHSILTLMGVPPVGDFFDIFGILLSFLENMTVHQIFFCDRVRP